MTWVFHPEAEAEVESIVDWYLQDGPGVAERFLFELHHTLQRIVDMPESYPTSGLRTRRALLRRFPYSVIYQPQGNLMRIVAVAHVRRRPRYWRNRI